MKKIKNLIKVCALLISFIIIMPNVLAAEYTVTLNAFNGTVSSTNPVVATDTGLATFTVMPDEGYKWPDSNFSSLYSCEIDGVTSNQSGENTLTYNPDNNTFVLSNINSSGSTIDCAITFVSDDIDDIDPNNGSNGGSTENPDTASSPVYMVAGLGIVGLMYGVYLSKKRFN